MEVTTGMSIEQVMLTAAVVSTAGALLGVVVGSITSYQLAKRQFSSSIIAEKRHHWKEAFRDTLAQFLAEVLNLDTKDLKSDKLEQWKERFIVVMHLRYRLALLLDGDDPNHRVVEEQMDRLTKTLTDSETGDSQRVPAIRKEIIETARRILGIEWRRIKAGE